VHLESEGVLQVVTRLLRLQPREDGRVLRDVHDRQSTSLRKVGGDFPQPLRGRDTVCILAAVR